MKTIIVRLISFVAAITVLLALFPQTANAASTGTSDFVTRFYVQCFNRAPDAGGLQYWVNQLESKQLTGADVASGFVNSLEFTNRNVSNDQYVNIMYAAFFNRQADAVGYNSWMNALNSGLSRFYVLAGFINSQEFVNLCTGYGINPGHLTLTDPIDMFPQISAFVIRFYRNCLGREADPAGLRMWVSNLQTGAQTACDVAYGFTYSNEFLNRNLSNTAFINTMYAAFFNRAADATGLATWTKYLNAGYTRHYVLAGFVNSQEFKNLCATYGINPGSLAIKQEDSSISAPRTCFFTKDSSGNYGIIWSAWNTTGKTIEKVSVAYTSYDSAGKQLIFSANNCGEIWAKSIYPCPAFSIFDGSVNLGQSSGTIDRIIIRVIILDFSDGTRQVVVYNQEAKLGITYLQSSDSDAQMVNVFDTVAE